MAIEVKSWVLPQKVEKNTFLYFMLEKRFEHFLTCFLTNFELFSTYPDAIVVRSKLKIAYTQKQHPQEVKNRLTNFGKNRTMLKFSQEMYFSLWHRMGTTYGRSRRLKRTLRDVNFRFMYQGAKWWFSNQNIQEKVPNFFLLLHPTSVGKHVSDQNFSV